MERSAAKLFRNILALALAMILVLGCFTGCAGEQKEEGETTKATQETSSAPTKETEETSVEYDHRGLHFKLDSSFTAGVSEDDSESFSFQNDQIQGAVEFGPLSQLTGGAADTSRGYAEHLLEEQGSSHSDAWVGTSTGFCYYVVFEDADSILVQGLYVNGQQGWSIWAQSTDPEMVDQLIRIVGRCAVVAEEVPA